MKFVLVPSARFVDPIEFLPRHPGIIVKKIGLTVFLVLLILLLGEYESYTVTWYRHFPVPNGPGIVWGILHFLDIDIYGTRNGHYPDTRTPYESAVPSFLNTSSTDAPRVVFTALHTHVFCYPKQGSREILALEDATLVDFEYLGLDRFEHSPHRLANQKAEDHFCSCLRHLGAKRWTSMERFKAVTAAIEGYVDYETAATVPDALRKVPPSRFERNWYSFCVEGGGKDVLVVEIPRRIPGLILLPAWKTSINHVEGRFEWEKAEVFPLSRRRWALARNMGEKCRMLASHAGAKRLSLKEAMEMVSGEGVIKGAEEK
ncbi:hypothetical protein PG993_000031 [Apiospora rasikravindrae]|uniref:Uncharacterized protein n=1 Tax=Apiospora rasikravindrae TaxID=990691 RepID=A0ABR1U7E5_9PEZI